MSERDELVGLLHGKGAYCGSCGYEDGRCADCTEVLNGYAYAILAAGYRKPRTITTAEELDGLAAGTVIRDSDPLTCTKWGSGEWGTFSGDSVGAHRIGLPATVLYEPTA